MAVVKVTRDGHHGDMHAVLTKTKLGGGGGMYLWITVINRYDLMWTRIFGLEKSTMQVFQSPLCIN